MKYMDKNIRYMYLFVNTQLHDVAIKEFAINSKINETKDINDDSLTIYILIDRNLGFTK